MRKLRRFITRKIRQVRKKDNNIIKNKNIRIKELSLKTPQRKGIVLKIFNMTPKKPNSALRKVAKIFVKGYGNIIAYIPGEKHTINIHNEVLIRKGKVQDLVNVNYKVIRGPLDAKFPIRSKSRSKYGTPLKSIPSHNK